MDVDCNQIIRKKAKFVSVGSRFEFPDRRKFQRQYSHIYSQRLVTCYPRLLENAIKKWGSDVPCRKLFELVSDERCVIIGTLYKNMPNKPNVLADITDDHKVTPDLLAPLAKLTSEKDSLILEDELQRIQLKGDVMPVQDYVTGVVLAVLGVEPEDKRGRFIVEDVVYLNSYQPLPRPLESVEDDDRWIAVVCGLGLGGKEENPALLQMFVDTVVGLLGSSELQLQMSKVVRLIVAGNSLSVMTSEKQKMANQAKYLSRKVGAGSVLAMSKLDKLLDQLSSHLPVCVMPGKNDPAFTMMPQQPLHKKMFPEAGKNSTFGTITNPCAMRMDERLILCTSGQNIDEIYKYSDIEGTLERMESLLMWGHLAPTCPDTLSCYPYYDKDPFILSDADGFSTPQVYIGANQSEFNSKIVGKGDARTLLVSVPEFHSSATCVLINPFTLQCRAVQFSPGVLGLTESVDQQNLFSS